MSEPHRDDKANANLRSLAERVVERARAAGAKQAAATISRTRFIELEQRDGKLEKIREADSSGLSLQLFVDGRYSAHGSSDLRWEAVERFIERGIVMTRLLNEDPHRGLADPALYADRPTADLRLCDAAYAKVDPDQRRRTVAEVERAARSVDGPIVSVTAGYSDSRGESVRVHSNGFVGERRATAYWTGASVTVDDPSGRKPSDWWWVGAREHKALPSPPDAGREAARRALERIGQRQLDSGAMTVVVENRAARTLVSHFLRAMRGEALQQKRSFLLDKRGQPIGNKRFTLVDDPLIPAGFGSRHYDSDGISARRRVLVERGTLRSYLIGVYYGRKLGVTPTGGSTSNLCLTPGESSRDALIAAVDKGILITGVLGGNSDTTRGDFSHGFNGYAIEGGKLGDPVGGMNITGDHRTFWNRLAAVGNDPYPYSGSLIPSLVFEDVSVSGT